MPSVPPYRAQLATLSKDVPRGPGWLHEVKYDGYRIGAAVAGGRATLWSRNGKDWTAQFPEVAEAVARLPVSSALLDGEVAVLLPDGRTSFQALQNAFGGARRGLVYLVFDLLHLDGDDVARLPLVERKRRLEALLGTAATGVVRYAPHVEGEGAPLFREACRGGLEGIVSKRRDAPYVPGRGGAWLKVKCTLRQELVVGGFTDPEGAREGIGALLVGYYEVIGERRGSRSRLPRSERGDRGGFWAPPERSLLRFAGKVGTGYTRAVANALRAKLDRLEQQDCPFAPRPAGWLGKNAHWVQPKLVAEVELAEWTAGGSIRHPSFQGLREDKKAKDVVRETPAGSEHPLTPALSPRAENGRKRPRAGGEGARVERRPLSAGAQNGPMHPRPAAKGARVERRPLSSRAAVSARAENGPMRPRSGEGPLVGRPLSPRGGESATPRAAGGEGKGEGGHPASTVSRSRSRSRNEVLELSGVRITNPQRVVYPDLGLTKGDVARYYLRVAHAILPHLRGRPLTLFHVPEGLAGEGRFMKHSKVWAPEAVRRVRIREKTKTGEYLVIDDLAALLSIVQMDVLELHTWNTTTDHLEEPDRIVLDLDPGPEVGWREVVAAARLVRAALDALNLPAYVKTTGGRGLHVVVPIAPTRDWTECLAFARGFAEVVVGHAPKAFTTAFAKQGREKKILLDSLRNNRTNTSVAAFSTRARPGAPVSVPIAWDELDPAAPPDRFTIRTVPRRLSALRHDPWAGYAASARPLDDAVLQAVTAPHPPRDGGPRAQRP